MKISSVVIDLATSSDTGKLSEIEKNVFDYDIISPRQMRYLIRKQTAAVFAARFDDTVVGYMVLLTRKNSRIVRIYSLAVLPEYRGIGVAAKLLSAAVVFALERGCLELSLELHSANEVARRLYAGAGFLQCGEKKHYYTDGATALLFRKKLRADEKKS